MKFFYIYSLVVFSGLFSNAFLLNSHSDDYIDIDFKLANHEIKKLDELEKAIIGEGTQKSGQTNKKIATFIRLEPNLSYNVDFNIKLEKKYNFESEYIENFNQNVKYSIDEHIFRGVKILEVGVYPFYKNNANQLNVIEEASIRIELNNDYSENPSNLKYSSIFSEMIDDVVLNDFERDRDFEYQNASALYICDPDIEDNPYMQALVNWRRQQGYDVTLVSTDIAGNSSNSIKSYIENAYYNWENPPEYICLVGDADGSISVPSYYVSAETGQAYGESDYPYTLIEGDDLYPEMLIGRISVRTTTELATVVNKIIGYEKAYQTGDWFSSAALVGDPYDSGISTYITNQYIEQIMENYGVENISTQYSGSNFDSFMRNQINSGIAYLNYRGFYGFSNFNQSDVNQLNNGYKLPLISTLTCGVNSFWDEPESVVEALLRAGSPSSPAGAVAVIGTSQSFTHTAFNNIVSMGIFEGIYQHETQTAGAALLYGKLALMDTYPEDPNGNVYLFSSWNNLMGDPLTHLWTKNPKSLIVDHDFIVSSSSNHFSVSVIDSEGRPMSDVIVTLYKSDEYSFNSITNQFGIADFNVNFENLGNVLVTSRCYNCIPEETSFEVIDDVPQIDLIESSIIIDDSFDGNDDGYANPGETVFLNIPIENQSDQDLYDCSFSVNSSYSEIQLINGSSSIASIGSNSSISINDISITIDNFYEYAVPSFTPPYHNLYGELQCQDFNWSFQMPIEVKYGNIYAFLELLSDENSNGRLDPGETGSFAITLENGGFIDLYGIEVMLDFPSDFFQIDDQNLIFDQLLLGDSLQSSAFFITASESIINGSQFSPTLSITSEVGYNPTLNTYIQVGYVASDDPLGPDEYGYYIYDESDSNYQWAPVYDWIEIDPDYGGDGDQLAIYDNGNNLDDSAVFDLPFTFTFYGEDYDEITICSNGWIALGATDMTSFRNYNLPGAGGPAPMIAVFWDDLKTTNGGEIYWYYNSIEDYLVIEWSNLRTYTDDDLETFQAILYNSGSSTPTGDDEIKLQYKEFNNTSEGYYPVGNYDGAVVHGQYSTIGLENSYGDIGIEYTFNNEYPVAAYPLSDESALFITTRGAQIFSEAELNLSNNQFNIEIDTNQQSNSTLIISNDGEAGSVLDYDISLSPFNDLQSIVDDGGYAWASSTSSNEQAYYDWVDISDNAVALSFNQNDQATEPLDIGFSFPFYNEEYSELIVNPNGWVGFGQDNNSWNNQPIFSDENPTNAIFAFWDDLNPSSSLDNGVGLGNVFIDSNLDRCIIWYDNVSHWTSLDRVYDFQLVLYPDGLIKVNYRNMMGDTESATIGIVNQEGTIGQQVVYNNDFVQNELSVAFKGKPDWLDYYQIDSGDNSLASGESNSYSIDINSYNLSEGEYFASLIVDPEGFFTEVIPINLMVMGPNLVVGDINFDQIVNILDIVSMMNFVIGLSEPTDIEFEASDINQDSTLDVLDIVVLVNIILSE